MSAESGKHQQPQRMPWQTNLSVKVVLLFFLISISTTFLILTIEQGVVRKNFFEEKLKTERLIGANIVHKVRERLFNAETLAASLANLGEVETLSHENLMVSIPRLLDNEATRDFIAGGGIWPEPYVFDLEKERASLFWGRNSEGKLEFYNDYNEPAGMGYHGEEWYVPSLYAKGGKCYWSQSYVDPYSAEPMVTCTVSMQRQQKYIGAATVDIMLSGLSAHIEEEAKALDGYGFILDRNNRFLTFKDDQMARTNPEGQSATDKTYIHADDLAKQHPLFAPIAKWVRDINVKMTRDSFANNKQSAAIKADLASRSYQIDDQAAELIASIIAANPLAMYEEENIIQNYVQKLDTDMFLGEPVFVHIFHMPETYWKVVLVVPQSYVFKPLNKLTAQTVAITALILMLGMIAVFISIQYILVHPVRKMVDLLKSNRSRDAEDIVYLDESKGDELGQIAHWYNLRTKQFSDTQHQLLTQLQERNVIERRMHEYTLQLESERMKLKDAKEKAEEANYAKSRFLSTMSHELRTPLNAVIGLSEIMMDDSQLVASQYKDLSVINKSANLLLTIIGDILDFSKIEAGDVSLEWKATNLYPFIVDIMELMFLSAQNRKVSLKLDYSEDLHEAYRLDQMRVKQVLINLISNAVKFAPNGDVHVRVFKVGYKGSKDMVRFEVVDNGIGIPQDKQESIFEHFTQADISTTRKYGGTGLGLAISRRLVHVMHGDIGVVSKEGKGATFWFELPLRSVGVDEVEKLQSGSNPANESMRRDEIEKPHALVVEDSEFSQLFIQKALKKLGYTLDIATDGESALEMYEDNNYNIILMDCMMPRMDGYETTRHIRESEEDSHQHVPIIALTANAMEGDREKCIDSGMDDYITKPMSMKTIRRTLAKYIKTATDEAQ